AYTTLFRSEQRDVQEAEKFLVRHGTIVNVLREYDDLEQTRLTNQVTTESKLKLESVLAQATAAVERDVTNLIKSRLLDVSAESDVYLQTLRNKNLLNRSEEHTSELQSRENLVCRLLLEKKNSQGS